MKHVGRLGCLISLALACALSSASAQLLPLDQVGPITGPAFVGSSSSSPAAPATIPTTTGSITALGIAPGTAGSFVINGGAGGEPSAIDLTHATNLPAGALPALTGDVTSSAGSAATTVGNLSSVTNASLANSGLAHSTVGIAGHSVALGGTQTLAASDLTNGTTGSGSVVLATSPTLVTPALGTPSSGTATNLIGLPCSTGILSPGTNVCAAFGNPLDAASGILGYGASTVNNGVYGTNGSGFPGFSTTIPPVSVGASATLPHVATNALLAAASTVTFPNGLIRDNYAGGSYTPPLQYSASGSACSLNSGAGDGGSQVPSSDSKCWLASFPTEGADAREFAAKFDSSTDNSTALQAWLNYGGQGNKLSVPQVAGQMAEFGTALSTTLATAQTALLIDGQGNNNSILAYTGSSGTAITVTEFNNAAARNVVAFSNFTVCTTRAGLANGIEIDQTAAIDTGSMPVSNWYGFTMRGCDGFAVTDYFAQYIYLHGPTFFNFYSPVLQGPSSLGTVGAGIKIDTPGGSASRLSDAYNFVSAQINNLALGLEADDWVQGVTVSSGSNFINDGTAIHVTSGTGTDQFTIADSGFNCRAAAPCLWMNGADVYIHHNYIILSADSSTGLYVEGSNALTFDHNVVRNGGAFTGTLGVRVDGELYPISQADNTYVDMAVNHYYPNAGAYPDFDQDNVYAITPGSDLLGSGVTTLMDLPLPFANVVACSTALTGREQQISDSTVNTFGAAITTGGGTNKVTGTCNGTAWTVSAI